MTVAIYEIFQEKQGKQSWPERMQEKPKMWAVALKGVKGSQGMRRWLGQDWRTPEHVAMAVKEGKAPKQGVVNL